MTVEFIRTKHSSTTSVSEYDMIIDGVVKKRGIYVNKTQGIDQRAINFINHTSFQDNIAVETDEIELFNRNLDYLCSLFGFSGNFKKEYPQSYKEVKGIF